MLNSFRFLALIAAFSLLQTAAAPAQKLPWHPRQGEALAGVRRVILVSPTVHVEKWTATSGWEAQGTADHLRRTICGNLDQVLEERQVVVDDYMLCLGESEANLARREALAAAAVHFRDMANDWSNVHHTEQRLEEFHLGDELPAIKTLDVDALILVSANGILTTKGEKARSAMGGLAGPSGPGQSLLLHIGMIRPQTGELVFFTEHGMGGDFLKHPEKMEAFIEKTMATVFGGEGTAQKNSN